MPVNARVLTATVLAGLSLLQGSPCFGEQAETEGIAGLLRQFQECWVREDIDGLMALFSDAFVDSNGGTKAEVREGIEMFLAIGTAVSIDQIEVDTTQDPTVISGIRLLESSGVPGWLLTFSVRKEDSAWRIVGTDMKRAATGITQHAMTLEEAFRSLEAYDFGKDNQCTGAIAEAVRRVHGNEAVRQDLQSRLLAILDMDAPVGAKDFACRQLALIGDESSVPSLARLLDEESLAAAALVALNRMPYPSVDAALLDVLLRADGDTRLGIINTLGDRASATALPALSSLSSSADAQVAAACIIALGKISTPEALAVVESFSKGLASAPPEVAAAYWHVQLTQADRFAAADEDAEALALYDRVLAGGAPEPFRSGAFVGKVSIQGDDALPWVAAALRGEDAVSALAAAQSTRKMTGSEVTATLIAMLPDLGVEVQVALIGALGDRGDRSAGDAIVPFLQHPQADVRLAAADALSKIGGPSCVAALAALAASAPSNEEQDTARDALTLLDGPGVSDALRAHLFDQPSEVVQETIRAVESRAASDAVPDLLRLAQLDEQQRDIRAAALRASGRLASPSELGAFLALLQGEFAPELRIDLEQAALALASRSTSPESTRSTTMQALSGASGTEARSSLYRIMGQIGDEAFLEPLRAGIHDADPLVRDAAIRALVEWPRASALAVLEGIMKNADDNVHRVLAARGVVRLLETAEGIPEETKITYCRSALGMAESEDQQRLILGALANLRTPRALELAAPYTEMPGLREDASFAAHRIVLGNAHAQASVNTDMAGLAIDGDMTTRWTSSRPQETGMRFGVDLGAEYEISVLVLDASRSMNEYPRAFQIGVSDDNEEPRIIAEGQAVNDVVRVTMPATRARKLWIILSASDAAPWSINEIEFLDRETGKLGIQFAAPP